MQFIAHNTLLKEGKKTIPQSPYLIEENSWWRAAKKSLKLFIKEEDYSKLRVVDLGCLEGGYTVQFAKLGFQSLGIEARQENVDKCNYVKDNLDLSNLSFIRDDVRNMANYGTFDVTFCYGLLYHLDDPANFLKTVSNCTSKILLLHTHYSLEEDFLAELPVLNRVITPFKKRIKFLNNRRNYKLSSLSINEGYKGRWYYEWSKKSKREKVEKSLEASYNNPKSFWPTKIELTRMLQDAGFTSVFEQFDFTGDQTAENYIDYFQRSMFVAVKH